MSILGFFSEVIILNNEKIFLLYANNFDVNKKEIKRKINHSLRVSKLCKSIALDLNLADDLIYLAEFIGLVHDIGRFVQWEKYQTFDDLKSEDHALLGLQVLFKNKEINRFKIDHKWDKTIYSALKNHNRYKIADETKDIDLLMSKILRDADKTDILYMIKINDIVLDEDNGSITSDVKNEFLNKESIDHTKVKSFSDKVLLKLAFVFDINYKWTLKYIEKENIIDEIYNNLIYKNKIKYYYNYVKKYLSEVSNGKI